MTHVAAVAVLDQEGADDVLQPRDGVIAEREIGPGLFEQAEGPTRSYRRAVAVEPLDDGRVRVRQTVDFQLRLPYFSPLFVLPLRRVLGALAPRRQLPWWAPPHRLDRRAAEVLATLSALAVVTGYVGGLLSLTMTYAAREFHVARTGQGIALGVVRINVVLSLGLLVLADRWGRRKLILGAATGAVLLTALGAAAPSLVWLTVTQIVAVGLTATLLVLLAVMAAEEMPAGSRAWALAVLTMTVGLGGGIATMALPLADLGRGGWRWLYVGALAALPLVASCARHLPESRRWQRAQPGGATGGDRSSLMGRGDGAPGRAQRRRLLLLSAGGFAFALFATPSGQFQNEFLRTERAFSAARISLFSLLSGTVGGLGVLVGGRVADLRGRRLVAAVGAGAGIVTTLASYAAHGWPLWAWGIADSMLGYAVAPALGVYGPELFPTSLRSRATGVIAVTYAAGGVVGLVGAGLLSGAIGSLLPALAVLAIGPALLVVLIVRAYPETARRELEDLNPGDAAPAPRATPQPK